MAGQIANFKLVKDVIHAKVGGEDYALISLDETYTVKVEYLMIGKPRAEKQIGKWKPILQAWVDKKKVATPDRAKLLRSFLRHQQQVYNPKNNE